MSSQGSDGKNISKEAILKITKDFRFREKQAFNKNVNNFKTGFLLGFVMLVVEKGCCFCQELLCFEPSEDFSGLSCSRSMLSDWCHWKQSSWMCLVHRSRSPGATGNNAPQAWLFQAQGLFLLVEEAGCGLVAGFRHYLNLLVFEGSFPHLVVHELVLLEHAQLHLRLDTHDLRDTTWGNLKASEKTLSSEKPFPKGFGTPFPGVPKAGPRLAGHRQNLLSQSWLPVSHEGEEDISPSCTQLFCWETSCSQTSLDSPWAVIHGAALWHRFRRDFRKCFYTCEFLQPSLGTQK